MKATAPFVVLLSLLFAADAGGVTLVARPQGSTDTCLARESGDFTFTIQAILDSGESAALIRAVSNLEVDGASPLASWVVPNPSGTWDNDARELQFASCMPTGTILVTITVINYDGRPLALRASGPFGIGQPAVRLCDGTVVAATTPLLCVNNASCCSTELSKATWGDVKRIFK